MHTFVLRDVCERQRESGQPHVLETEKTNVHFSDARGANNDELDVSSCHRRAQSRSQPRVGPLLTSDSSDHLGLATA